MSKKQEVPVDMSANKMISLKEEVAALRKKLSTVSTEKNKYYKIFKNGEEIVFILDGKTGIINEINSACKNFLGLKQNKIIGRHYTDFIVFGEDIKSENLLNELKFYGSVLTYHKLRTKDAGDVPVDMTLNIISPRGKKMILISCRDISERIRAENEIKRYSVKLEESNLEKDKFFSLLAHDLRNVFSPIISYSEILLNEYRELNEHDRDLFIDRIEKISKNSYRLLDDLMIWARIRTGEYSLQFEKIVVNQLVSDLLTVKRPFFEAKKISVEYFAEETLQVNTDFEMLKKVINNLLGNALKYSYRGGKVAVKIEKSHQNCIISVRDNGVGIKDENLDKIFILDKHSTTRGTEEEEGNGMGLMLSKEFLRILGGKISVNSRFGFGSEFVVTYPLA
ncbi:MAG: PAS domain-containing sensor histidine kinase [Ignavibacteriales bacterium]|nr:PAS domain-containing sensor histidine kinase [Ignavibacteriales bacterium]MCF8316002.1 PAS domain-containing sensor histidine kinase [Ignavibacteriales bacterium]MCF8437596.1 PAS domain-containing sensor histidine kinase [Ignavibacteriales bacterium]